MIKTFWESLATWWADNFNLTLFLIATFILICVLSWLVHMLTQRYLVKVLRSILRKMSPRWSDFVLQRGVINRWSHLAPALVFYWGALLFNFQEIDFSGKLIFVIQTLASVYAIVASAFGISSLLNVFEDIYNTFSTAKRRPIKSYLQVLKTFLAFFAILFVLAVLLDKSLTSFLTGFGAATAIILLVFKDSILGFVTSVQLAAFDLVRIGDWITVSKFGVDGDVEEISLTTVKVRNFDKTVSTIPTHALLTDGVKNWRGMQESGGRRIKRSLLIDSTSITMFSEKLWHSIKNMQCFVNYFANNSDKFELKNGFCYRSAVDLDAPVSNVAFFRDYIEWFLLNHSGIYKKPGFTFLVRELEPNQYGLPIELYVFTKTTNWVEFEGIQSDIFDHLLAVLPYFALKSSQLTHEISGR